MNIQFVRTNVTIFAMVLFILLYSLLIFSNTSLIYNKDGTFRSFGIGYNTRSVLPVWLMAILIAIVLYFIVLYYVSYPKIHF